jgi:hypothetical protein
MSMAARPPLKIDRLPNGDPRPLDDKEKQQVWAWERLMTLYYVFAMVAIFAAYTYAQKVGNSSEGRWMVVGLVVALVAGATYVQFSGRCPRCGALLGRQTRLVLPRKCKACGVAFPKKTALLDSSKGH